MPSRGMNAQKSDLISDPDVGKAFKYHAQYPGVMQGSQEGKFRSKHINENSSTILKHNAVDPPDAIFKDNDV